MGNDQPSSLVALEPRGQQLVAVLAVEQLWQHCIGPGPAMAS